MEDALAHALVSLTLYLKWVLILVLMEDALALMGPEIHQKKVIVLILVLMEDALARNSRYYIGYEV